MAIPHEEALLIGRWCARRVPARAMHQVRVECEIEDRHVTIYEVRAPWDGVGTWTRFPIARLRYTMSSGLWALYWRDRNLRFHEYQFLEPDPDVRILLDHIANGGDPIFWG